MIVYRRQRRSLNNTLRILSLRLTMMDCEPAPEIYTVPLLNTPMDILLEIFELLYPGDLLKLAHTSKSFRLFLMSRRSNRTWVKARENVPGLPSCPPGVSEPYWADLLFVERPLCDTCGKYTPRPVNFLLRGRFCQECTAERCVDSVELRNASPADTLVLDSIPYMINGESRRLYRRQDIRVMREKLLAFQINVDRFSPGSGVGLAEFRNLHAGQAALDSQHIRKCQEWENGVRARKRLDARRFFRERMRGYQNMNGHETGTYDRELIGTCIRANTRTMGIIY